MHRALEGGHVQRVSAARLGGRDVVVLQVRFPRETRHLVAAEGLGVATLDGGQRARLREAMGRGAPRDKARWAEVVTAADPGAEGAADVDAGAIVDALLSAEAGGRRDDLRRALGRAVARVERRAEAVRGDLSRAEGADALGQRAQLFVVEAGRAPRGATRLVAVDWSSGEPRDVELKLDPARGAREQLDAAFQRARRLKEGARIGRARLAEAEAIRARLGAIAGAIDDAGADLAALEAQARAAAPRDFKLAHGAGEAPGRKAAQGPAPPFRRFLGASGEPVLVGRSGERNDELTFHVARPHDLWLHAKNRAGAHVVVPLRKGASCPAELLVEAAHLAAHFSESRDEDAVEIQYTPRRYLRKPRGSAPGLVVVDREKVLLLRRQPDLLRQLLEREVLG